MLLVQTSEPIVTVEFEFGPSRFDIMPVLSYEKLATNGSPTAKAEGVAALLEVTEVMLPDTLTWTSSACADVPKERKFEPAFRNPRRAF